MYIFNKRRKNLHRALKILQNISKAYVKTGLIISTSKHRLGNSRNQTWVFFFPSLFLSRQQSQRAVFNHRKASAAPKMPLKTEHGAPDSSLDDHSKAVYSSKVVVLADLNVDPPEMDDDSSVHVSASTISRLLLFLRFLYFF